MKQLTIIGRRSTRVNPIFGRPHYFETRVIRSDSTEVIIPEPPHSIHGVLYTRAVRRTGHSISLCFVCDRLDCLGESSAQNEHVSWLELDAALVCYFFNRGYGDLVCREGRVTNSLSLCVGLVIDQDTACREPATRMPVWSC